MQPEIQEQTLQNDQIRAVITQKLGCSVQAEVDVFPLAVQAAHEKAFKSVKKEVSLPGFRKGKAPDAIVLKQYKSTIEREWRSLILRTAFHDFLELAKVRPLSENSVRKAELKKCSLEEGATCLFHYESEPTVVDMDFTQFNVHEQEVAPVSEEDVQSELDNIRLAHATWEDVEGRACQEDDYIEVDVDVIENPAHNLFSNRLFRIHKDHMPAWLYEMIHGMNVGDAKDGLASASCSSHDPHHTHSELCSSEKAKQVRVTVKTIKKAILPEENDELAQKCSYETMEKCREELKQIIAKHRLESILEDQRMHVYGQILEHYPIDVPQSLVDVETKSRLQHIKRSSDLKKGNLPLDKEKEQLLKAQVESEARGFFICMYQLQHLAQKAAITINQNELMQEYMIETVHVPYNQRLIYPGMEPEEIRSRLFTKIMMRKAIDYIIESKKSQA